MPQDVRKANHTLAQGGHGTPFDSDVLSIDGSGAPWHFVCRIRCISAYLTTARALQPKKSKHLLLRKQKPGCYASRMPEPPTFQCRKEQPTVSCLELGLMAAFNYATLQQLPPHFHKELGIVHMRRGHIIQLEACLLWAKPH